MKDGNIPRGCYKIVVSIISTETNEINRGCIGSGQHRYVNTAEVPRPRTSIYGKRSFRFEAAQVWNSLPNEVRLMTSFDQFRNYINSWCGGQKCYCSSCRFHPVLSQS
ncbi:Hypothetical predicted protein [Mytilus galloprovincialis]|uniref:Uncharacterized protein n=1 Tax=Mytilus galloprovincialis TaxID=29158 RepID=A0A8B6DLD0_MYTGA|nr:Hypothetical predicted protein [Mytilus galloprovincialis]